MIRAIALLLISNVLCAQHPYFELDSRQLETKAVYDGYRIMISLEGDEIIYTLTRSDDTIVVAYDPRRKKPLYIKYRI